MESPNGGDLAATPRLWFGLKGIDNFFLRPFESEKYLILCK
jgi:hypothetical protein